MRLCNVRYDSRHDNSGTRVICWAVRIFTKIKCILRAALHFCHVQALRCAQIGCHRSSLPPLCELHTQTGLTSCLSGRLSVSGGRGHASGMTGSHCVFVCVCVHVCEKVCVFVYPQLSIQWFWFGRYNHLQTRSCVSPHVLLMSSTTYPVVVQTNKGTDSEAPPPNTHKIKCSNTDKQTSRRRTQNIPKGRRIRYEWMCG